MTTGTQAERSERDERADAVWRARLQGWPYLIGGYFGFCKAANVPVSWGGLQAFRFGRQQLAVQFGKKQ